MKKKLLIVLNIFVSIYLTGCAATDMLNPFTDNPELQLGRRDSSAITQASGDLGGNRARDALEAMSSYRRTQEPQPYYPVIQPSEVRLMWVPDHVNKAGDLVPAHYYYLKVLDDRWAVQDAFDLEDQLNTGAEDEGSATPWVIKEKQ